MARVEMGALPVHGYAVTQTKEFWSHSDYDGSFWTISVDDVSQLNTSDIPVSTLCYLAPSVIAA